jgi:hypothetical protein
LGKGIILLCILASIIEFKSEPIYNLNVSNSGNDNNDALKYSAPKEPKSKATQQKTPLVKFILILHY